MGRVATCAALVEVTGCGMIEGADGVGFRI